MEEEEEATCPLAAYAKPLLGRDCPVVPVVQQWSGKRKRERGGKGTISRLLMVGTRYGPVGDATTG